VREEEEVDLKRLPNREEMRKYYNNFLKKL
jgi:hypothetical protein